MVVLIHPPDPQTLLPPLLACLPTAFASPRPPPALLSLLSPILRQRLSFLSQSDNWLKLMCWDSSAAESLWAQIEDTTFEPHPSSGEIEVGDVTSMVYKRFDEETLKAQLVLSDWPFTPIFLWCTGGDDGDGWKLSDLLPSPSLDSSWSSSIQDANTTSHERIMSEALAEAESSSHKSQAQNPASSTLPLPKEKDNEEDDYWAQYDRSPGRTPVRKPSVPLEKQPVTQESDYYARYTDVQPAMDAHDPDEAMPEANGINSTLNGHAQDYQSLLTSPPPYQDQNPPSATNLTSKPHSQTQNQLHTPPNLDEHPHHTPPEISQPCPSSPSSRASASNTIARLESAAERYNASEIGIRQHISTSVKSMYRLAKAAGMERAEFEELIVREVEGLRVLEMDE